jgi:Arc/MetJ family transcription regulator
MKTTVDIPEQLLSDAMRFGKASTKREAVVMALEAFNRRARLEALVGMLGQSDTFMTLEELLAMRMADLPGEDEALDTPVDPA